MREKAVTKIMELRDVTAQRDQENEVSEGEEEEDDDEWEDEEDDLSGSFSLAPSERQAIENACIRQFKFPKNNFKAKNYADLFDWSTTCFSEPPNHHVSS